MKSGRVKKLSIAVIGNNNAGKSTFIGVTVDALRRSLWRDLRGIFGYTVDSDEQLNYEMEYGNYLDKLVMLPADYFYRKITFPLFFIGEKKYIVEMSLYDMPPWFLEYDSGIGMMEDVRELLGTIDAFILMIDPFSFEPIAKIYQDKNNMFRENDSGTILKNIVDVIGDKKRKVRRPIALVLSKTDELTNHCGLENFTSPPCCTNGKFDMLTAYLSENKVRKFFDYVSYDIDGLLKDFETVELFGTNNVRVYYDQGNKLRVFPDQDGTLNPIYWIFSQHKIIKKTR